MKRKDTLEIHRRMRCDEPLSHPHQISSASRNILLRPAKLSLEITAKYFAMNQENDLEDHRELFCDETRRWPFYDEVRIWPWKLLLLLQSILR